MYVINPSEERPLEPIEESVPDLRNVLSEETSPGCPTLNEESLKTDSEIEDMLSTVERVQEEIKPPVIIEAFHRTEESEVSSSELGDYQIYDSSENAVESTSRATIHAFGELHGYVEPEVPVAKECKETEGAECSEPVRVTTVLVELSAVAIEEGVPHVKEVLSEEVSPRTPTLNEEGPKTDTEREDKLLPVEVVQEGGKPPKGREAFELAGKSEVSGRESRNYRMYDTTSATVESASPSTDRAGREPYSNAEEEIQSAEKECNGMEGAESAEPVSVINVSE
ncbi:unnamed protein product [Enterobius vermicularis]|uniref:Cardiomyopathy-associated protein 5 n=1 Tax=Enterobius vermicularis TaxID=51028 RepID=A0A0N4V637_ENTVE|nr:unnamed protein product [Enterobius vermicularis]